MTDRELLVKAQGLMVTAADTALYCRETGLSGDLEGVDVAEVRSELRRIEDKLMALATVISHHLDREGVEKNACDFSKVCDGTGPGCKRGKA